MYEREAITRPLRRGMSSPAESAIFRAPSWEVMPGWSADGGPSRAPVIGFDFGSLPTYAPEPQIGPEGGEVSPATSERIQKERGGGAPLASSVQQRMEGAFGHNFADVRVHADGEADALSRSVGANAFTLGSDIFLSRQATGAGPYGGDELVAHELMHVVQQRGASRGGRLAVGAVGDASEREAEGAVAAIVSRSGYTPVRMASLMPASLPLHHQIVQRQPLPQSGALTVQTASRMVESAFRYLFHNQRSGLQRLHDALQKKKAGTDLIATLAAAAVGAALTAVLGPVGPAAEALVLAEDEVGRSLVKKSVKLVTDKAVETAKDSVKEWMSAPKKSDPIDNFIEAESLAINKSEEATIQAFLSTVDGFSALPGGPVMLQGLAKVIDAQAEFANSLQIAHSAGAWASLIAEPGDDSKAWANDDQENYAEKGALEIATRVTKAPITGPGDIQITGSNWKGINRETERVVQEHAGATIGDLGTNLRISVETPVGDTRCEIPYSQQGNPIIPEKSTLQGVMAWLISGKMNPSLLEEDRMAVVSAAAVLGFYLYQKSVTELHFG